MRKVRSRPLIAALALVVTPLLVAASDPAGDVAACPGSPGGDGAPAPDLVSARGRIVELGTSALWTLRFADALQVPDDVGTPFRVDLVLRDPAAPVVRFAYYRRLNRLIRYDAVRDPQLEILLLPERGQNVFLPPAIEGDTMTFQVPGRILSADEDETGTSPGIAEVRWSVIVRDGNACDLLGDGRPSEPMIVTDEPAASPSGVAGAPSSGPPSSGPRSSEKASERDGSPPWIVLAAAGATAVAIVVLGFVVRRRHVRHASA